MEIESVEGTDGEAKALLSAFTDRQLKEIFKYLSRRGPVAMEDMAQVRRGNAVPPHYAIVDSPVLSSSDIMKIMAADTIFTADELAVAHDEGDMTTALVRGLGMEKDRAEEIAENVVTEDGATASFLDKAMRALPDLPVVEDERARDFIRKMVSESDSLFDINLFGGERRWKDTLFEYLRLGEAAFTEQKRRALQATGYAFEYAASGAREEGNPMEDGYPQDLGLAVDKLLGMKVYDEAGNVKYPTEDDRMAAADEIGAFIDVADAATMGPYHEYAMNQPEEGGLFGSIGRFVSKAARTVTRAIPSLAKIAAPIAGGMVGGPIGMAAGAALSRAVPGGRRSSSRRPATSAIRQVSRSYTRPTMSAPALLKYISSFLRQRGY